MREILFRAKDESGHWHEGQFSYVELGDKAVPVIVSVYNPEKYFVNEGGTRVILTSIPVDVNTRGQYTFQEYHNGKQFVKVFTGDIGEFDYEGNVVRGVAMQSLTGAFYLDTGKFDDPKNLQLWWLLSHMDVRWVGNIHDNPELLTK